MTDPKILRLPAVLNHVGLGKTSLYAAIRRGDFPRPIRLSERAVGWRRIEIDEWISSRPLATGEAAAT